VCTDRFEKSYAHAGPDDVKLDKLECNVLYGHFVLVTVAVFCAVQVKRTWLCFRLMTRLYHVVIMFCQNDVYIVLWGTTFTMTVISHRNRPQ
jgi:hypothetical protein